jgi:hypothetical protein
LKKIELCDQDQASFVKALNYAKEWCSTHQWEVGAAEMALGAAAIAWSLQNGTAEMGRDLVASAFADDMLGAKAGSAVGAGIGVIGSAVLGSVGVTALGGAIGVPAILLMGGGALLLGSFGYTVGDLTQRFLNLQPGAGDFVGGASAFAVGLALLVDGARRVVKDQDVLELASAFKDGAIYLADLSVKVVATTLEELQSFMQSLATLPKDAVDATGSIAVSTTAAAAGTAIGSTLAAGSVTVLGSSTLGTAALSLGLVSAPLWPVIAGGAAGLAIGYGAWKAVRFLGTKT